MTKVHPNVVAPANEMPRLANASVADQQQHEPEVLTVWRKSLLFNCNGFTVFDSKGNLVFRVDNYASEYRGEIVLMDSCGNSVLTIRRKKLSLSDQWLIYNGEECTRPLFSIKKHVALRPTKTLLYMTPGSSGNGSTYRVDGSYHHRNCAIYNPQGYAVAEIRQKESKTGVSLGNDVFRLVVQSEFDKCLAMAVVIVLDQIFGPGPSMLRNWSF
ncbi:LURP-one-like protein [Rhynchospora pubera]|uniref:LURP-one-like protein n=1 Tax=Rhynchospora pubera TaxID=906938 RepID=A0AAV8DI24_9POAL|nr:LURP-one-like protein [Rhynchospora pubera]